MRPDPAFAAPGRFWKGNIHTHSTRSDGARGPEEVCAAYREAGYDFLALTDHFQEKFGFPIVDTRGARTETFTTILGAEVHAPATALGETWHILAVGLPLDFAHTPQTESGPQLAQRCLDAGAFVALPHPGWYALSTADAATIPGAHAVEIYNHTSATRVDRGDGAYLVDQLLAEGRRINLLATDDAHFHSPDWFGGWVMVKAEANEPEALLMSLKAGHFYSTQGPAIEAIHWGEESVEIHCSPASMVAVLGRGSRAKPAIEPGQTRVVLPLEPRLLEGGFGRIVVMDEAGKKAWSNPYWF